MKIQIEKLGDSIYCASGKDLIFVDHGNAITACTSCRKIKNSLLLTTNLDIELLQPVVTWSVRAVHIFQDGLEYSLPEDTKL